MLECEYCKVEIEGEFQSCPLCNGILSGESTVNSTFPLIPTIYQEYNKLIRIMIFISIVTSVVFVAINMIFLKIPRLSIIIIAALACMWMGLILIIRKKDNIPKTIMWLVALVTALAVIWDYSMGWMGWSINYVLPLVCTATMIIMAIAGKILKIGPKDYIVYILIDSLFGFIPIIFLAIGLLKVTFPSIICVATSAISVSALLLFQGQNTKQELNKRMHL